MHISCVKFWFVYIPLRPNQRETCTVWVKEQEHKYHHKIVFTLYLMHKFACFDMIKELCKGKDGYLLSVYEIISYQQQQTEY